MNKLLGVNDPSKQHLYDICIYNDYSALSNKISDLSSNKYAKICIVTDSNVADLHLDEVVNQLSTLDSLLYSFTFDAGEASKNFTTLNKLYEYLINNRFDRYDLLIALGGGVVGDLCGYCAASYLRGIDYIQVPTTLLSQVDSSVGGKTAIDFMQYKNMIGAFYMPKLVYINVNVLKTLDSAQFSSGMGEVIKHGLIRDKAYYQYIIDNKSDIALRRSESLIELIYGSVAIKSGVVEEDPTEKGIRAYLNFGHTIGHAIEKLSDYKLFHGECVALGMVSALYISHKLGNISEEEMNNAIELIKYFDLPVKLEDKLDPNLILNTTKSDKKMVGGKIKFVILNSIGEASTTLGVDNDMLLQAINYIL